MVQKSSTYPNVHFSTVSRMNEDIVVVVGNIITHYFTIKYTRFFNYGFLLVKEIQHLLYIKEDKY